MGDLEATVAVRKLHLLHASGLITGRATGHQIEWIVVDLHFVQMVNVEGIPIDLFATPMAIEGAFTMGVIEHHSMLIGVVSTEAQSQRVTGTIDDHISM